MADITVEASSDVGMTPTLVAANAGGDAIINDSSERIILMVKNDDASATTVTPTVQDSTARVPGFGSVSKSNAGRSVAAGAVDVFGPFPSSAYNDSTGRVQITYSKVTSLTVAAVKVA